MTATSVQGLQRVEQIMGMPIEVDVRDRVDVSALDAVFEWFRHVDRTFSTYKPDSDVSRFNQGDLSLGEADPDLRRVLASCEQLRFETQGYFDIQASARPAGTDNCVPAPRSPVDPSGYVKGWSVDRAAEMLRQAGAHTFAINAGGDVVVHGAPSGQTAWIVGIRHPRLADKIAASVAVSGQAVATSGAYERGQHIVDPHSGHAPSGVISVTIVGPQLGRADAYATAAFAMGRYAPSWAGNLAGYEAMVILDDDTVLSTPGFPSS